MNDPLVQAYTIIVATYKSIFNINIKADVPPDVAAQVAAQVATAPFTGGNKNARPESD